MPDQPDEPDLKPASESPWYVLMTVAGEQEGGILYDQDLHARNRRYWNGWQAQALSAEQKRGLIEAGRVSEEDLAPLTEEEEAAIAAALDAQCPDADRPDPKDPFHLPARKVERDLICAGFIFSGYAYFGKATFSGYARFENATFSGPADFANATFSGYARFGKATFSGAAIFGNATFSGTADFASATFSGPADFENATFSGYADFGKATFSGYADFGNATFENAFHLTNGECVGPAIFAACIFRARVDFTDRKFKAPTDFARCSFLGEPPRYFNAELHEDTRWKDVRHWPLPEGGDAAERADFFIRSYERLKLLMDSQKKTHDEQMFHRMEMRCREIEAPGTLATWGSTAFRWLSDYGWSLGRPAAGLAALLAAGWALIFIAEWWDYHLGDWPDPKVAPEYLGFWQSGAVSLSNVFGFLGFGRTFLRDEIATLTAFSEIVSATQTIAGLVLFFLLGLGLRNRYRMR